MNITPKHSIRFSFVERVGSNNRLSLPDEQSAKLNLVEIERLGRSPTEGLRLTCPQEGSGRLQVQFKARDGPTLNFGPD